MGGTRLVRRGNIDRINNPSWSGLNAKFLHAGDQQADPPKSDDQQSLLLNGSQLAKAFGKALKQNGRNEKETIAASEMRVEFSSGS